jgi:amino acid transporter
MSESSGLRAEQASLVASVSDHPVDGGDGDKYGAAGTGAAGAASSSSSSAPARRLTTIGLAVVAVSFTAGGPFGIEAAVQAAGPLVTIIALLFAPVLYVLPQIVIVSELATMFPTNHGSVRWVRAAFGEGVGFFNALVNVPPNLVDAAVYPTIFASYIARAFIKDATAHHKQLLALACIVAGTTVSLVSAKAVGNFATVLTFALIVPFVIVICAGGHLVSWPAINQVRAVYAVNEEANYGTLLSTVLWLFTGWRSLGSLGGEVTTPSAFLHGMLAALLLGEVLYLFPLLVAMSVPAPSMAVNATAFLALSSDDRPWHDGYLVTAFKDVYHWLGVVIAVAGALTGLSQFACCMLVYPRTMWGCADAGWLPGVLRRRTASGTPWVCVLVHAAVAALLTFLPFSVLVRMEMLISAPTYLLSMWALARLRYTMPDAPRPFRWPNSNVGAIAIVAVASIIFVANFVINLHQALWIVGTALGVHATIIAAYFAVFRFQLFGPVSVGDDIVVDGEGDTEPPEGGSDSGSASTATRGSVARRSALAQAAADTGDSMRTRHGDDGDDASGEEAFAAAIAVAENARRSRVQSGDDGVQQRESSAGSRASGGGDADTRGSRTRRSAVPV